MARRRAVARGFGEIHRVANTGAPGGAPVGGGSEPRDVVIAKLRDLLVHQGAEVRPALAQPVLLGPVPGFLIWKIFRKRTLRRVGMFVFRYWYWYWCIALAMRWLCVCFVFVFFFCFCFCFGFV